MVIRSFLTQRKPTDLFFSVCLHTYMQTKLVSFQRRPCCQGSVSKWENGDTSGRWKRDPSRTSGSKWAFQVNAYVMTNLQEQPTLLWMCTNCFSGRLGQGQSKPWESRQHPQRQLFVIQDITWRRGINFLQCNLLFKLYLKVLKNNIIPTYSTYIIKHQGGIL